MRGDTAVSWEKCRDEFEWDGSLRDLYVLGTDLGDWQRLLDLLRELALPMVWESGSIRKPIPDDVSEMMVFGPDDERGTLKVNLHGIWVHTHFFAVEEIELDIDPREIQDETAFGRLLDFMRRVARRLGKPVILTPENFQASTILTVPPSGAPIYHPPIAGSGHFER
jgi:hypothetical protein